MSPSRSPRLIMRYRIWYNQCFVLFNSRDSSFTLWKYTQIMHSQDTFGLSLISGTPTDWNSYDTPVRLSPPKPLVYSTCVIILISHTHTHKHALKVTCFRKNYFNLCLEKDRHHQRFISYKWKGLKGITLKATVLAGRLKGEKTFCRWQVSLAVVFC